MQRFAFRPEVRTLVAGLVKVMEFGNRLDKSNWSSGRHGVYNHAYRCLMAIIKEECGSDIYNAMPDFNFGGNESWLVDVEVAITQAQQNVADEDERLLAELKSE